MSTGREVTPGTYDEFTVGAGDLDLSAKSLDYPVRVVAAVSGAGVVKYRAVGDQPGTVRTISLEDKARSLPIPIDMIFGTGAGTTITTLGVLK